MATELADLPELFKGIPWRKHGTYYICRLESSRHPFRLCFTVERHPDAWVGCVSVGVEALALSRHKTALEARDALAAWAKRLGEVMSGVSEETDRVPRKLLVSEVERCIRLQFQLARMVRVVEELAECPRDGLSAQHLAECREAKRVLDPEFEVEP